MKTILFITLLVSCLNANAYTDSLPFLGIGRYQSTVNGVYHPTGFVASYNFILDKPETLTFALYDPSWVTKLDGLSYSLKVDGNPVNWDYTAFYNDTAFWDQWDPTGGMRTSDVYEARLTAHLSDGAHRFSVFYNSPNVGKLPGIVLNYAYTGDYDLSLVGNITPVPEPETYAMMLIGLTLISFVSLKKKTNLNLCLCFLISILPMR